MMQSDSGEKKKILFGDNINKSQETPNIHDVHKMLSVSDIQAGIQKCNLKSNRFLEMSKPCFKDKNTNTK